MISLLDQLVLTTAKLDACVDFYTRVLGIRIELSELIRRAFA